jgi:hypothetical protein
VARVPMDSLGKLLLVVGVGIALLGLLFMLGGRIPFLGNLPGDVSFERGNARFYVPIATSIVVSIVLTIVLNVAFRLFGRS